LLPEHNNKRQTEKKSQIYTKINTRVENKMNFPKRLHFQDGTTGVPVCKQQKNFPFTQSFAIDKKWVTCRKCQKKLRV